MCVSAAAPLTLNATTGDLTTTADPVSIKGVAVTDTSGVDFVEGTGITITSNTGVSPDTATLAATLGTAIDTSEITDGTIAFADVNSTQTLAGNPANGASSVWFGTTGLIWEGSTSDTNEGLLVSSDVTADRTWTLPNETGTICTTGSVCSGYQASISYQSATATNQSANIGSTNLIASATAGRYRICGFITLTTAAGTSSTLPALVLGWTDVTDSNVKAFGMTTASAANLTSVGPGNCTLIDAKGSTAITYSTTGYTSNPAAAMKFKVYLTAEAM